LISSDSHPGLFQLTSLAPLTIIHSSPSIFLSFLSLAYGIEFQPPVLNVFVSNSARACILPGIWPEENYENSSMINIVAETAILSIFSTVAPISLTATNSMLNIGSETVRITGSVCFSGSNIVSGGKYNNLILSSLTMLDSASFDGSDGRIVIQTLNVLGTDITFTGSAIYEVCNWPTGIFNITFDKLVSTNIPLNFDLGQSSFIRVTDSLNESVLFPTFIGEIPTAHDLFQHMGETLTLAEIPFGARIKANFPDFGADGFTTGTQIYKIDLNATSLSIRLSHNLSRFSNHICYDSLHFGDSCPPGYLRVDSLREWGSHVHMSVRQLFFFVNSPETLQLLDFSSFPVDSLDVTITGGVQAVISLSSCQSIANLTLVNVTLFIEGSATDPMGNWTFINSTPIGKLQCNRLSSLGVDLLSLDVYTRGCHPQHLFLLGFDNFTEITFTNDAVVFGGSGTDTKIKVDSYDIPRLHMNTITSSLAFLSDPNAVNFTAVVDFQVDSPNHTITFGRFPDEFQGIFGHKINGTLNAMVRNVPLDVTGVIDLNIVSNGSVNILYPSCVNTHLHPDGMPPGSVLTFEEAYFGVNSNISIPEDVTFVVGNGYFNRHGRIAAPVNKLRLARNLTIFSWVQFIVSDFDFIGESATLHIEYRLAEIPYLELNRSKGHSTFAPVITFAYKRSRGTEESEIEFLINNPTALDGVELPIVCGENLDCWNWTANFSAPFAVVNGTTSILEAVCRPWNGSVSSQCFAIRKRQDWNSSISGDVGQIGNDL
jgi:hypothetical protein